MNGINNFIILGILVVFFAMFLTSTYNNFVRLRENVSNAMAQIATQVESRWDVLSNLIEATKRYSNHESEVLNEVTRSRSRIRQSSDVNEVEADQNNFDSTLSRLIAVAESYPELRASEIYQNTMNSVNEYEDNVRYARMIYNDTVTQYNRTIKSFPSNLIANMFAFKEEDYFANTEIKNDIPSWS